jgi:hypothetical protein
MIKREAAYKRRMRKLIRGLQRNPIDYDSHCLADIEFLSTLIGDVKIPIPPPLRPERSSGWALLQALGLLTLDGLRIRFSQDKPDSELTVGLVFLWVRDLRPILYGSGTGEKGELKSYSEVIAECRSKEPFTDALEMIPQVADWPLSKFDWITDAFASLDENNLRSREEGKKPAGDRTAGNRRDKALAFLYRRVEQVGRSMGLSIDDLFQGPSGATGPAPQIPDEKPVSTSWDARLSECVTDYRAYELRRIEQILEGERLAPSFDWFLPRRLRRPPCQPETEEGAHVVGLADICRPGLRTALLDHRGSGTTTVLLWLSWRYCTDAAVDEPVVLRIDAKEYRRFAVSKSPVQFLAQRIYGKGREVSSRRTAFEEVLNEAETILLVDNLARVPPKDRVRIGEWLESFSGAVFTAPLGIPEEDLAMIGGEVTVRAEMAPLDEAQLRRFISEFAERSGPGFNPLLAYHIAERELPETAQRPLGLAVICEQVRAHNSDCASVIERLIAQLFSRDGQPSPQWDVELAKLSPTQQALLQLAVWWYSGGWHYGDDVQLGFDAERAEDHLDSWGLSDQWPEVAASPLLIRTGPKTYQFLNREVHGFLVAVDSAKRGFPQCGWKGIPSIFESGSVGVAHRHYLALLESNG